ncbi:rRNA N6-adenosine-methyltransferase ZCCHC4 isoform X2 [Latimeria chalumnae]|uniref:rRNA N6-adenosine-methyltransferase ZCCHC4 isoform X2 n=1 Tax=Latimeria chalumnae TaxID=7897 RepID=UPI00313D7360
MTELESLGIEVILNEEAESKAPACPHGPTLLFVKVIRGEKQGRRFYACSACRDRKDCNFFQWEDEKISEARRLAREEYNKSKRPAFTHKEFTERTRRKGKNVSGGSLQEPKVQSPHFPPRYGKFISLPLSRKSFCQDCQLLLLPNEQSEHGAHHVLKDVSLAQLKRPSQLLRPLENKKTNAQYLFADRSCHFLLELILSLGFRRVLCVGTPRLHELIKLRAADGKAPVVESLLLDIDFRYSQFYSEDEFCHYNMFNHYFFGGETAVKVCRNFLRKDSRVLMVTDPPFGGLVEPLAYSFKKLITIWRTTRDQVNSTEQLPIFWIFPYFFESRILHCFPTFSMLDYQVDYDNHALYKHGKTGRKQSPVRIFTNLSPSNIVLPTEEGYRYCSICQRYVSSENSHCEICKACTSKDGRRWKHCSICDKCVKPTWVHCESCNHCALQNHTCGRTSIGCFTCGSMDHKRTACPNISVSKEFQLDRRKKHKKKATTMKWILRKSHKSKKKTNLKSLSLNQRMSNL